VNPSLTAALSAESVQNFLHQIEAQLVNSDAYQQLLSALQAKLGSVAEELQSLLTAFSREAIQHTLHKLIGETPLNAESSQEAPQPASPVQPVLEAPSETEAQARSHAAPANREEALLQLGQKIKQTREAKGLTLEQLHRQTYVPLHHIKALELGQLEKLPEDVFIRGFVRQLGNALGMNGVALAAVLPSPESGQQAVPNWRQKATLKAGLQLSPVHLYVGYAALMAGAVGGLTWITQPVQPDAPAVKPTPKASVEALPAQQVSQAMPRLAHSNVSAPEVLPIR
jgi:cytoskeleton protein RodZ